MVKWDFCGWSPAADALWRASQATLLSSPDDFGMAGWLCLPFLLFSGR